MLGRSNQPTPNTTQSTNQATNPTNLIHRPTNHFPLTKYKPITSTEQPTIFPLNKIQTNEQIRDVLERSKIAGFNRKLQLKPRAHEQVGGIYIYIYYILYTYKNMCISKNKEKFHLQRENIK